MNDIGNYSRHAAIWDWSGYDRTSEYKFWSDIARVYGLKILSAMSAIGEAGAYLATNGLEVTALDITSEMIIEGQQRYGHLSSLKFVQADIREFKLNDNSYDFAFIGSSDLHHIHELTEVKKALNSLHRHLRIGGGLCLELWYPSSCSWKSPRRKFEAVKIYERNGSKIWKEGQTEYDAFTQKVIISQDVYIQKSDKIDHFTHNFELQLFNREEFIQILTECGFKLKAEYGGYEFEPWKPENSKWIIEVIKE